MDDFSCRPPQTARAAWLRVAASVRQRASLLCISADPSSPLPHPLSTLSHSFPLPLSQARMAKAGESSITAAAPPPQRASSNSSNLSSSQSCDGHAAPPPPSLLRPGSPPCLLSPWLSLPAVPSWHCSAAAACSVAGQGHRRVREGLPVLRRRSTIADEPPTTVTDEPQCLLCFLIPSGTLS